ncbi:CvpA family protein [Holosporaceae bacterium 'Namur']|nr:CvpA family protein [Holosporaceae bacterium 'Namur']
MNFNEFNLLDLAVVTIVALSTIFAIFRGLIASVLSLTGWILSIYLTDLTYPHLKEILVDKISNEVVLTAIGYGGLMIFFLIFFAILNGLISSVKILGSKFVDSTLGAFFGFFRGFLIASFFYFFLSIGISLINGTEVKDEAKVAPNWLKNAQTYDLLKFGKQLLLTFTSEDFNEKLDISYQKLAKKSKDERFISYAKGVMLKSLSKDEQKHIEDIKTKEYLTKSDEEIEISNLRSLLELYRNHISRDNNLNRLDDKDIERLEDIINDFKLKNDDRK